MFPLDRAGLAAPLFSDFMLNKANLLLREASDLLCGHEGGTDLLIQLLARKKMNVFPKRPNHSFNIQFSLRS